MKKIFYLLFFINCSFLQAQITADFSISSPNGCSPLNVNFTDQSIGNISSWNWDLGNGNNSTQQNPGSVYINPGTYTICLTVSDGILTDTKCDSVVVFENPTIDFVANDSSGCANLTVDFTNQSTTGTGIASALWNFGDGSTSNAINPSHTFTTGTYTITLIVTDNSGCVSQGNKQNYINSISLPSANFSATNTQSCSNPNTVNFTNTSTNDIGATYLWNFGDGNTSSLENPSHTYTAFSTYDVQLIVNKNGCIDSITKMNFVNMQTQNTDFSANITNACVGQSINFSDLSSLTPTAWNWTFGDGNSSATQNPSHTYTAAGVYTVSLSTTLTGCNDSETKTNYITINDNPTVSFSADATDTCSAPFLVNFTSTTSPGVSYNWNFGDGNTSALANPSNTYTSNGSFNVSLTVTNANNCSASSTSNSLINITPPSASFIIDSVFGCAPKTVQITDQSSSNSTISNWYWDFGDGTSQTGPQNPSHTFVDTGRFEVLLAIETIDGCTDTLQPGVGVMIGETLAPNFSATPLNACKLEEITFTNLTDTTGVNNIQWLWDFGDGGIDMQFEPTYQYGDTGTFEVSLRASHNGCAQTFSIENYITIHPPIAAFSFTHSCNDYQEVNFTDESIGPENWTWDLVGDTSTVQNPTYTFTGNGPHEVTLYVENSSFGCIDSLTQNITIENPSIDFEIVDSVGCAPFSANFINNSTFATSYVWDFGDGGSSNAQNPTHTYANNGTYDVRLIVTNIYNCMDTLFYPNMVTVVNSSPNFSASDTVGCRPFTTNFLDLTSSLAGPIVSWSWNFGDGTTSSAQNPTHTYSSIGNFTVSLTTTDSTGCTYTNTKAMYISVTGPLPSFNNVSLACVNSPINFNNTSSSAGGTITTWAWDFGDGNTSNLQNPTHTYSYTDTFTVSLYLQDDNGCDTTIVKTDAIIIDTLIADFVADSTVGNCTGFIVNFDAIASPNPTSYLWDFGDGTSSNIQNPSTVYSSIGNFDVSLIVSNTAGCIDTILKPDFIVVNGPYGDLSVSVDTGCLDLEVEFTITNTNSVNQIWDFGDGTVLNNTDSNETYTYTNVSVFNPLVILEDSNGCQIPYYFDTIYTGSLSADFESDTNYVCTPGIVNFTDLSQSNPPANNWQWTFGDGNTSNQQNPTHNYTSDGVFDIELIISNIYCNDTMTKAQYIISDTSTSAQFSSIAPALICPPALFSFNDMSSADSSISNWNWDFGNGTNSSLQNPMAISFDTSGNYIITLDITTIKGCMNSFSDTIRINELPLLNYDLDSINLCLNNDTTLVSIHDSATITWTPANNLSCSDCPDPTIFGVQSNTYFVQAENQYGCTVDDTLYLNLINLPDITSSSDQKVTRGTELVLNSFSSREVSFEWTPSENLSCNDCPNTIFIANETTDFFIDITDKYGCKNQDTIHIEVFDVCAGNFLLFPNIFTPNNDGQNDIFKPTSLQNLNTTINYFRIFDRWGKLIFETDQLSEGWNGNAQSGNYMNNGVYVYTLEVVCFDGSTQIYNGNVSLIR